MMEKRLFHSKSEVVFMQKMSSKPLREHIRFPRQFCSCRKRGFSVNASYSLSRTSSKGIDSVAHVKLWASSSGRINGMNGVLSSTSLREAYVLDAFHDEYEGVIINSERLPQNVNVFASVLQASILNWKWKGKKGVWLKLPLDRSDLVPIAIQEGFKYHHAEPEYVMLTYWIPKGPCMLPANASHQVGVGGFVINNKNEVLVVQEKHCASTFKGVWKLPTGFILESEEIFSGAVREVKEETGIDTEFVEVIAFRHVHNVAFGKSDLFFICMLRPLSTQIEIDEHEIQAAKWMPLTEFVEQPFNESDQMSQKILNICIARLGKQYCGLTVHQSISKFDGKASSLYYNVVEPQDVNCKGK